MTIATPSPSEIQKQNFRNVQIDAVGVSISNIAAPFLPVFLTRLGASGTPFAARVLIVRLDDGPTARSFRGLYPSAGIFRAKELIARDGLGDCAWALANGADSTGPLWLAKPRHAQIVVPWSESHMRTDFPTAPGTPKPTPEGFWRT